MAIEDRASGKWKQLKGKANEITGAIQGDTSQELKGKIQKNVGKAQEKVGEAESKLRREMKRERDVENVD